MTITIGGWAVPLLLTAWFWWLALSCEGTGPGRDRSIEILGALAATFFVWMIYFAIGWWLA